MIVHRKNLMQWGIVLCAFMALTAAAVQAEPPGQIFALTTVPRSSGGTFGGDLYVPPAFHPNGSKVNLIFHLHGSHTQVRQNIYDSGVNSVGISIVLNGLSSVYSNQFDRTTNRGFFQSVLDEALSILETQGIVQQPQWGTICLSAFSAGYGGVREIIAVPEYYSIIKILYCADCPHTSYVSGNQVNPAQMVDFLRFSQDAAAGTTHFLQTHSQIVPGTYASTTECADYLIAGVGATRISDPKTYYGVGMSGRDMQQLTTATLGNFKIRGFSGNTANDHMDHFYVMDIFYKELFEQATPQVRPSAFIIY
jgi:hypothetical protein